MKNDNGFISQKELPFKIIQASYNTWVGGQPGIKGYHLNITMDSKEIQLDSAYFRNLKGDFKKHLTKKHTTYTATFISPSKKNDLILHGDAQKEFGNQPQKAQKKIPFELKENEAIIIFNYNEETYFYKIFDLKKVDHLPFP
jgi:hypothetical protein